MWNPVLWMIMAAIQTAVVVAVMRSKPIDTPAAKTENIHMESREKQPSPQPDRVHKSNREWKDFLTSEQFFVLRQKGTEAPFTGRYNEHFEPGVYKCAACGQELFTSDTKFRSHCGWPAFSDVVDQDKILKHLDKSHGMTRTEVVCSRCGGHLGHVFRDGSPPTGLRYCINSAALEFEPASTKSKTSF